jgi:hypothetical protein
VVHLVAARDIDAATMFFRFQSRHERLLVSQGHPRRQLSRDQLTEPPLTPEQRRVLEELGIERLKMRLDPMVTGIGDGASVFGLKPDITRRQAEQWMMDKLRAEKRLDDKEKGDTLWWAKAAAIGTVIVPVLIFLLERLFK